MNKTLLTNLLLWYGCYKRRLRFDKAMRNAGISAIFHDSGHMFLSHVSEHYFCKSPLYKPNGQINALMDKAETFFESF